MTFDHKDGFLYYINGQYDPIELRVKTENTERAIWFPDCWLIVKDSDGINAGIHRKSTLSERYRNFISTHSQSIKLARISSLASNVGKLFNDDVIRIREMQRLQAVLRDNI